MQKEIIPVPQEVITICQALANKGGTPFIVGGYVRDHFLKLPSKDIDIEVFKMDIDVLMVVLGTFGPIDTVGKKFGIIKLTTATGDYDFSLPRRDNNTGAGHKDFEVTYDPDMTPLQATMRRDFTMNAMMWNPLTGELLDFHRGQIDITCRIMRHVDSRTFGDDPLRVLRGIIMAGRIGGVCTMANDTSDLCKSMLDGFHTLPKDRIWTEWRKLLLKGKAFADALSALQETGWNVHFPQIPTTTMERNNVGRPPTMLDVSALNDDAKIVLRLAGMCLHMESPKDFLESLGCPKKFHKRVFELVTIVDEAHLSELDDQGAIMLAIGTNLKLNSFDLVKLLLRHAGHFRAIKQLAILERQGFNSSHFKRLVTGKDMLDRGWDKGSKQELGKELKRLFRLQMVSRCDRTTLLRNLKKPRW